MLRIALCGTLLVVHLGKVDDWVVGSNVVNMARVWSLERRKNVLFRNNQGQGHMICRKYPGGVSQTAGKSQ
ncbi:hypothetical protein M8C21_025029 [Ambrosia artemisiifolia]|uniref:Secreted protein n=1 Tax=Ambrosia artemisiifolia TaxID=4212 RepID=A0AAD5DCA3_AMBAR|nr:hypothetical protein M8C21_025029 [Ambrosia artemisiifolia]